MIGSEIMVYYSRKATRIPNYDYSKNNYYFITICTHEHKCIFGMQNQLSRFGEIVRQHILNISLIHPNIRIDKYVIMPNHIHLIIALEAGDENPDIRYLIAVFKTSVTKDIRKISPGLNIWQRSFHDHIIRNEKSYQKIWEYIENNPMKWKEDCFYTSVGEDL